MQKARKSNINRIIILYERCLAIASDIKVDEETRNAIEAIHVQWAIKMKMIICVMVMRTCIVTIVVCGSNPTASVRILTGGRRTEKTRARIEAHMDLIIPKTPSACNRTYQTIYLHRCSGSAATPVQQGNGVA